MLQVTIGVLILSAIVFSFGLLSARASKRLHLQAKQKAIEELKRSLESQISQTQAERKNDSKNDSKPDESPIFEALGGSKGQKQSVAR
jgi:hypothetical protein